jgi:hypothetical protein
LSPIPFGSPQNTPATAKKLSNDIYADLVGLDPTPPIRKASYSGGILQPNSPTGSQSFLQQQQQQPLKGSTYI